jgi:hypothetical protein
MKDKFTLSDGQLSVYALACGYWQEYPKNRDAVQKVQLWHEGACFHVRHIDYDKPQDIRVFWESFHSIGEARKLFAKTKQLIKGCAK